jgi:hypothetical protein
MKQCQRNNNGLVDFKFFKFLRTTKRSVEDEDAVVCEFYSRGTYQTERPFFRFKSNIDIMCVQTLRRSSCHTTKQL